MGIGGELGTINEVVGDRNKCEKEVDKTQIVRKCSNNELWKYIRHILLEVKYGKKGCRRCGVNHKSDHGKATGKIQ